MTNGSDEYRAYHRTYYQKRRKKIIDFLGGRCVKCGTTEDLQVDHIDRAQKSFSVSQNLTLESIVEELAKCQLLCREHHREKTSKECEGFTHGTFYAWAKKKCNCQTCITAKWKWHDERNARRRTGVKGPYNTKRSPRGDRPEIREGVDLR